MPAPDTGDCMSGRRLPSSLSTRRIASRAIVLSDRVETGTITIEGGVIAGIDVNRIDARAEDHGDAHIIPGLIELHTDHLEPHFSPRPKVFWDPCRPCFHMTHK